MKSQPIVLKRMDGREQTWTMDSTSTAILGMAAGLNGSPADRAIARACRAGIVQIYGSADMASKAIIGHKPEVAKLGLEGAGSAKQLLVDALDLHPQDVTEIGPFRLQKAD